MLNPFAPHITEEIYNTVSGGKILDQQSWVKYDEKLCVDETVEIVAQVNGKLKTKLIIPVDMPKDDVLKTALDNPKVAEAVAGKTVVKQIYVPNKLVNFVAK